MLQNINFKPHILLFVCVILFFGIFWFWLNLLGFITLSHQSFGYAYEQVMITFFLVPFFWSLTVQQNNLIKLKK